MEADRKAIRRLHRVKYEGCTVAVSEWSPAEVSGDSPLNVFFIHGRFATAELWTPLIERLPARYRYLMIGLPGFGGSLSDPSSEFGFFEYGQLVSAVVRELANGPVAWVGHEVGAALALASSLEPGSSSTSLTLINPAWLTSGLGGPRVGASGWLVRMMIRQLLKASLSMDRNGSWMLQRPWDHWRTEVGSSTSAIAAWRNLERTWPAEGQRRLWHRRLRELKTPVLMLVGSNDWVHPPELSLAMLNRLPEAYFFESDCGHWPFLERPDWVASKIQNFLFVHGRGHGPGPGNGHDPSQEGKTPRRSGPVIHKAG